LIVSTVGIAVSVIVDPVVADFRTGCITGRILVAVIGIVTVDLVISVIVNTVVADFRLRADAGGIIGKSRVVAINEAVAVVVQTVAKYLGSPGVDRTFVVVAIGVVKNVSAGRSIAGGFRHSRVTETVSVEITVIGDRGKTVINAAVAVVVEPVADFSGPGIGGGAGIVAVRVVRYVTAGLAAGLDGAGGIAEGISVAVRVKGGGQTLVGLAVTVVVDPVTYLSRVGVDRTIVVVAVSGSASGALGGEAVTVSIGAGD
jgi:hypothetical protein